MKDSNTRAGSQRWQLLKSSCHAHNYDIYSQEDLIGINKELGIKGKDIVFRLMNDIRLEPGTEGMDPVKGWSPIGDDNSEENHFLGTFDGRGHTISGLWIAAPEQTHAGLWGAIGKGAIVKDLCISIGKEGIEGKTIGGLTGISREATISNCRILSNAAMRGEECTGGLAGYLIGGTIEHCTVRAIVEGSKNGCLIGGLAGCQYLSNIYESVSESYVHSNARRAHIGGMVGMQHYSSLYDCEVKGEVYAQGTDSCVGGIVGEQYYSNIFRSKTDATVRIRNESNYYGRLVGLQFEGIVNESFSAGRLEIEEAEICSIGYHLYNYRKQINRHKAAIANLPQTGKQAVTNIRQNSYGPFDSAI